MGKLTAKEIKMLAKINVAMQKLTQAIRSYGESASMAATSLREACPLEPQSMPSTKLYPPQITPVVPAR